MADFVFEWPLKGEHIITAGYKYNGGSPHNAIDLRVAYQQPVYAAKSGTVNYAYTWNGRVTSGDTNSYGNFIKILHDEKYNGKTLETLYAHLDSYVVRSGQKVDAGELIGYAGYTGYVIPAGLTGRHLHFEVRLNRVRVNPLVWLDDNFQKASTAVYTFAAGEKSAVRDSRVVIPEETIPTVTRINAAGSASSISKSLSGNYKTTANLNIRDGAGTKYKILTTIPKGTLVSNYGYYSNVGGTKWLYV